MRIAGWIFPAGLLLIGFVSFAPVIPLLGVYWDDWPSLWFLHLYGPNAFPQVFAIDRPLQGQLFVLTTTLLGESMLAWHLFGLLARWACALAFGWVLWVVRPEWKSAIPWVVLLFFIYPGFNQQYIPITYSHQFVIYAVYLASHAVMVLGLRRLGMRRCLMLGLSLLLAMGSLLSLEYFFGLELLRVVWIYLAPTPGQGASSASAAPNLGGQPAAGEMGGPAADLLHPSAWWEHKIFYYLPYLLADSAFLAWRMTHETPRGQVRIFDQLAAGGMQAVLDLLRTVGQDTWEAGVAAWGQLFSALSLASAKPAYALPYLAVVLAAFVLTLFLARTHSQAAGSKTIWMLIPLGLFALLAGGWPFWATGLRIELSFPWDRFTLPMMIGSSLLLAGTGLLLVDGLERLAGRRLTSGTLAGRPLPLRNMLRWLPLALVVGLAAGAQFRGAIAYRQDWLAQRELLWQLAWRVPGLQEGTLLLTTHLPFAYVTDNSLTAPINWMYGSYRLEGQGMPYLMYDLNARLGNELPSLDNDLPVSGEYRLTHFSGSTGQALVFYYAPPRCVKVVARPDDLLLPNKPELLVEAFPLSRPELIQVEGPAEALLAQMGVAAPEKSWCYYFEKAELAVQQSNWPAIVALAAQARPEEQSLEKEQAGELVPFILGYGFSGRWEEAMVLSQRMDRLSPKARPALCAAWQELAPLALAGVPAQTAIQQAQAAFACPNR